jgi:hypothetical protein
VWGGQNKLDALFNDKSHTYNVEPWGWVTPAATGVGVGFGGSYHGHDVHGNGFHVHPTVLGAHPGHTHPLTVEEEGGDAEVSVMQPYLTVYTYIRS